MPDRLKKVVKAVPLLHALLASVAKRSYETKAWVLQRPLRHFCQNLPSIVSEPVFVKVGANDGITGDPCSKLLLANEKWRGLLIEPVPYCFERLKATFWDSRRFRCEPLAIGPFTGEATFFYVDAKAKQSIPGLPLWFDQLGSFDRKHITKHLNGVLEPFINELKIPVCPLSDILVRDGIQDVHLLHVDTEGYDYKVLKSLDFTKYLPLSIFIEHKHLPGDEKIEMMRLLLEHDYSVRNCGGDYFALRTQCYEKLQSTRAGKK